MKPTHPVELLACSISTQEGWFDPSGATISQRRRNPGDLRYANQIGASWPAGDMGDAVKGTPPIAQFSSNVLGITALFRQLWLQVAEGQTVRQIISQWAPPTENNTSAYLQDVLGWTGLPADVPVLELLPPLVNMGGPAT